MPNNIRSAATMIVRKLCPSLALVAFTASATTISPPGEATTTSPDSVSTSLRPFAVSEVNGKVSYAGGGMNSSDGHNFEGSVSFPIADKFGLQVDALYSRIDSDDFYGGGGHLFWRDPNIGLIGLAGGYLFHEDVDTFQVGIEAEYYLKQFTFGAFAGVGSINYSTAVPFIDTSPTHFVGRAFADWYASDDLRVGVSCLTAFENYLVKAEAEYQTPIAGLALTAEVAAGKNDYDHWLLGLRYYFGGKKSLKERHREDDPRSLMPQILHGLGLYGAEYNRKGEAYFAAHPDAGNWTGGSYGLVIKYGIDNDGKGSNGVGNGPDPQPPGNPPIIGGPGIPGNPGNKGAVTSPSP